MRPDATGFDPKGFIVRFDDGHFMKALNVLHPKAGLVKTAKEREAMVFPKEKSAKFWVEKIGRDSACVAELWQSSTQRLLIWGDVRNAV